MRWLFGSTVVGLALSLAWSVPQRGQAQGKAEGVQEPKEPKAKEATSPARELAGGEPKEAPKHPKSNETPPGPGFGYQPDYRYRPGTPGYPYMPNPYGPYSGMYPPYGGYTPYGYPPSGGYMPYGGNMGYGGYSPYGMSAPVAPASEAEVAIYDNYFEPRKVYVTPGATVHWINKGKRTHNVRGFEGGWGSKEIPPGKSYSFTLPKALNYHYYCTHHPLEMSGTIVVRPPVPLPPQPQGQGQGGYTKPGY
jgi:plastocyanin